MYVGISRSQPANNVQVRRVPLYFREWHQTCHTLLIKVCTWVTLEKCNS